jgi:uncharacterized membrane protein
MEDVIRRPSGCSLAERLPQRTMNSRTDAMVNGALIALGALGIIDNALFHWWLGLHRAVPGPQALPVETALVVASILLLSLGLWRERRARRRERHPAHPGRPERRRPAVHS